MNNTRRLQDELSSDAHRQKLSNIYGCHPDDTDIYARRFLEVIDAFAKNFGDAPQLGLFSAPGRVEIGGNHTDHQQGCVLAGSVNLDVIAAATPNNRNSIRIKSEGYPLEEVDLSVLEPVPGEVYTSRALVRGIAARFKALGQDVRGFDMCAASNVLKGSGLSSSAAFEVLVGNVMNGLFCGGAVPEVDIAKIGRYAENNFFGKPCGLMDQMASAVGGVAFMDFSNANNPAIEKIALDLSAFGYDLCVIDSGANHADMSDEYATIPGEMGLVAGCFGKKYLREVSRDDFFNEFPRVRKAAGDRAVLRAFHFFDENQRARDEAEALRAGRFNDFLALVNASGRSSFMYLQNVLPPGPPRHQEMGVALALCDEFLRGRGAFRVHGGGFAGTVQAFVPSDLLDAFALEIEAALGKGSCHIMSIRPVGGVQVA